MEIALDFDGRKGAFFMAEGDRRLDAMEFTMAGEDKMIIDHTEVDESLRGTGAGRKLLDRLIAYVREKDIKVIPLCPYAKSVFDRVPEIRDVLL